MAVRRRLAVMAALLLTACGAAGRSDPPPEASAAPAFPSSPATRPSPTASPTTGVGLDTDQPCTARLAEGLRPRPVLVRPDDLEAMVLPQADLGGTVAAFELDPMHSGYMDNEELVEVLPSPPTACEDASQHGRITGYAATFIAGRVHDVLEEVAGRHDDGLDAAVLLSLPVPRAGWGPTAAGMEWDWWFGGCTDNRERVANDVDPEDEAADVERFGRQVGCAAMYSAPDGVTSTGLVRVFSSVTSFTSGDGATGYLADWVTDQHDAAATGILASAEDFDVPTIAGAVGLRTAFPDLDLVDTRVMVVRDRVLVLAAVQAQGDDDRAPEAAAAARALAGRLQDLLPPN